MSAAAEPVQTVMGAGSISAVADLDVARQRLGADARTAGFHRAQVEAHTGAVLAHALDLVAGEAAADVAAERLDLGGQSTPRRQAQRHPATPPPAADAAV